MKKYVIVSIIGIFAFSVSVYALTNRFNINSSNLTFNANGKKQTVLNNFDKSYNLSYSISDANSKLDEEIKQLSKKTTYLLLGKMNGELETDEEYYQRHKEYFQLAAYNFFPRDKNTTSGYDETIEGYNYASISELAIPQLFNQFNELKINYNSYGEIRITKSNNLVISTVVLPNVIMKEESKDDPNEYVNKKTNLIIYYYFIKINDDYKLGYLYGDTDESIDKYTSSLVENETDKMSMSASYTSNLSTVYNFDKLNSMTEQEFTNIYNSNSKNVVYLSSYYNNKITGNANGFFINDGIIVTTWNFIEKALSNSQYITVKSNDSTSYAIDGIITANPEMDIVVIKLKNKNGSYVNVGNIDNIEIEDPAITLSSKSGTGIITQKGIIVSKENYVQTSIPLTRADEGSPLFDKNGNVIGLNTAKSVNSSISISISSKALKEVQDKFSNLNFENIKTITFEKLKEDYYYVKYNDELVSNTIPKSKWNKFSKIGDLKNNIKLKLVKASYKDNVVSLRYKNDISNYIDSMQLSAGFREQLVKDGYKEITKSSSKYIYQNNSYKVIIMNEFDYLIIVMVKL